MKLTNETDKELEVKADEYAENTELNYTDELSEAFKAGAAYGEARAWESFYWLIARDFGSGPINPNHLLEEIKRRGIL
jgi:hypothetical protein